MSSGCIPISNQGPRDTDAPQFNLLAHRPALTSAKGQEGRTIVHHSLSHNLYCLNVARVVD